jgi:putative holliday junction resolvase
MTDELNRQRANEAHLSPLPSPLSPLPPPGRVAGIDFGRVRIGIAISNAERTLASPYENYTRGGPEGDARRFRRLLEEEAVTLWVVGLPVHLDGRESAISRAAREFGDWLAEVTNVPVVFFDERFSTSEAHELMKDAGMKHSQRRRRLDMLAAQVVLAAYLESQSKGKAAPGPLD